MGIYEALVTTLAGLMVAIPAAVASHYFEGRINRIFGDIEELSRDVADRLEDHSQTIPPPISTKGRVS